MPTTFEDWEATQAPSPPLTPDELDEIFTWTRRHGSGNCWTGITGTAATHIVRLLRERQRLIAEVTALQAERVA